MKYIVFVCHRYYAGESGSTSLHSFEVNSEEAASQAVKKIKTENPHEQYDKMNCFYLPKGPPTKEEILLSLNAANPMASPSDLEQRAEEFLKILKK